MTYPYRTKLDLDGRIVYVPRTLNQWDAAATVLTQLLADEAVEVFGVLRAPLEN